MRFIALAMPLLFFVSASILSAEEASAPPLPEALLGKYTQGWGGLGINTGVVPPGHKGAPLRLGECIFDSGFGHHAPGELPLELHGGYVRFQCEAGVHWQGGGKGSVCIEVWCDGEKSFESPLLSDSSPACPIDLPVQGVNVLRLVARDAGDGITCDAVDWVNLVLIPDPSRPVLGEATLCFNERPAPERGMETCGLSLIADEDGPQLLVFSKANEIFSAMKAGETMAVSWPVEKTAEPIHVDGSMEASGGEVLLECLYGGTILSSHVLSSQPLFLHETLPVGPGTLRLEVRVQSGEPSVRFRGVQLGSGPHAFSLSQALPPASEERYPPPVSPVYREALARQLIEWDWRMQDGIGTPRAASDYAEAIRNTLARGQALFEEPALISWQSAWVQLTGEYAALENASPDDPRWEDLWRRVHETRRALFLAHPLSKTGPLLFVKQVPSSFSHQLTQYYGRLARPGGGLFVLDKPGASLDVRPLSPDLPEGSYMQPDVSYDGRGVVFAYTEGAPVPSGDMKGAPDRYYRLYQIESGGAGFRPLTDGPYDDFSPRYLPDGRLVFTSTPPRRIPPLRRRALSGLHPLPGRGRRLESAHHLLPRNPGMGPRRTQRRADHLYPLGLCRPQRRALSATVDHPPRRLFPLSLFRK